MQNAAVIRKDDSEKTPACKVRQLFDSESSTYTYLLEDTGTKAAVIIDPVLEKVTQSSPEKVPFNFENRVLSRRVNL